MKTRIKFTLCALTLVSLISCRGDPGACKCAENNMSSHPDMDLGMKCKKYIESLDAEDREKYLKETLNCDALKMK